MKQIIIISVIVCLSLHAKAQNKIESTGNVGIGTTSPNFLLHLKDPNGGAALGLERAGKLWRFDVASNAASKLFIGHTDKSSFLTLSNQGYMGIGTTSPSSQFHVVTNENAISWSAILNNTRNSSSVTGYGVGIKLKHSHSGESWKWSGIASIQESSWANNSGLALYADAREYMRISASGNVGIGTTTPSNKLSVNGTIRSKEVKVESSPWPDYVFEDSYQLKDLAQVADFISLNGHLPNIPSAKDVEANGILLGEMNAKLLEKIEELTLYIIDQNKKIKDQDSLIQLMIENQENKNKLLKNLNDRVENLENAN